MELYTIKEMAARRRMTYHRLLDWVKQGWVESIPKDPTNIRSQRLLTDDQMDKGLERVAREVRKEKDARRRVPMESGDTFLTRLTRR